MLEGGLVAASRARDGAAALYLRGNIGWALVHGPWPTSEGVRYWNAFRDEAVATGQRFVEEWAIRALAFLHAMEGQFDQARRLAAKGAAIVDELGRDFETAGGLDELASTIETLAGNAAAAERALRANFERLEAADERPILATVAALLADCVLAQGRLDEADALTRTAALGPSDDVYTQSIWRSVRAKVLARRGDHAAAERLAREAVGLADRTDCLWLVGHAQEALGEVLALAVRPRDAEVALREALAAFDRKGIRPAAERVREKLQSVAVPAAQA
jgi:tetratricopeptide (TPR) repeat protein